MVEQPDTVQDGPKDLGRAHWTDRIAGLEGQRNRIFHDGEHFHDLPLVPVRCWLSLSHRMFEQLRPEVLVILNEGDITAQQDEQVFQSLLAYVYRQEIITQFVEQSAI
tara:strand:+ start:2306 stop:2629 length:324 start_codon:yes stop_codon:yes gene_type:complete